MYAPVGIDRAINANAVSSLAMKPQRLFQRFKIARCFDTFALYVCSVAHVYNVPTSISMKKISFFELTLHLD